MGHARVEDKMRRFKGECAHFSFKKCPIYTHDGASANLALTHTNRITVDYLVQCFVSPRSLSCLE